jgi:hypothetical protein
LFGPDQEVLAGAVLEDPAHLDGVAFVAYRGGLEIEEGKPMCLDIAAPRTQDI